MFLARRTNNDKSKKQRFDRPTFRFGALRPLTASPPISKSLPHHNHFASLEPRRVRNRVQGWSAFHHFWVIVCPTSTIKGDTHQVGSAEHRGRHFQKCVWSPLAKKGFHLSIFIPDIELPNFGLWRSMYDTRTASLMMRSLYRYQTCLSCLSPSVA